MDETKVAEAINKLRESLKGMDRGRALYLIVTLLFGDKPDEERAVCDPDTGRVLAYLVPPGMRHARQASRHREKRDHAKPDHSGGSTQ